MSMLEQDPQVTKREIKLSAEIARLRAEVERLKKFITDYDVMEPVALRDIRHKLDKAEAVILALERCEGGRGAFSCCELHDIRCPKSRAARPEDWKGEWKCECGREALDAALAARRERA